jgi:hypothetical protein
MREKQYEVEGGWKWEGGSGKAECGSGKSLYLIPCSLNLKPKIYLQHAAKKYRRNITIK